MNCSLTPMHCRRTAKLPGDIFAAALRISTHRLTQFAGQCTRCAEAIVKLISRHLVRVARLVCTFLRSGPKGILDTARMDQEMAATLSEGISGSHPEDEAASNVVDTTARFIVRGGRWQPNLDLARAIHDATVVGKRHVRCLRQACTVVFRSLQTTLRWASVSLGGCQKALMPYAHALDCNCGSWVDMPIRCQAVGCSQEFTVVQGGYPSAEEIWMGYDTRFPWRTGLYSSHHWFMMLTGRHWPNEGSVGDSG